MRLYSFTNMYVPGIHAGIQTAHAIADMQRKYEQRARRGDAKAINKKSVYDAWADDHKTIIVKNGGNHEGLESLYRKLTHFSTELGLPLGKFYEPDLHHALTSVVIVVPGWVDQVPIYEGTTEEQLNTLIQGYRLAN